MIFFHAICLLVALGLTYGLNWLASIIPAHAFQELSQFVVPVIAVVSTFFIASTDDVGHGKPSPKPKYLKRAILIGLICFGAWYYFSHLRYTSEVISQLQEDYEDPKQELYAAYEEEFGVSGFMGYLLWSAKAGAHVSLSAEDSEPIEFDLPSGWFSFVVNWVYRVVNLFMVVLWVTQSYNYLKQEPSPSKSAASPARTTKTTSTSRALRNAHAFLQSGEVRRKQGDHEGAIADYTEALRLNPALVVAYNNRGLARREKGDLDGAIADYTEAIRLNPGFAVAYTNRGYMFQEKGDLDGAIADYTEAIRLDPKDKWPYNRRGYARLVQGDHDGAIADGTEAIRLDPADALGYSNRGIARHLKGDHDGAIADFDEALRRNPSDMTAYTSREIALKAKGDLNGTTAN
ncbi:MAG: tetratricopeptide repeat protein [Anaerolineales bacterium]|nr:tetratricopeptide repeat protein [Anaerolineales bacterium]